MWYHNRKVDFCGKEITTWLLPLAGLTNTLHWNDKKKMQNKGTWCYRIGVWLRQMAGQLHPQGEDLAPGDIMKRQLGVASLLELAEQRYVEQSLPERKAAVALCKCTDKSRRDMAMRNI